MFTDKYCINFIGIEDLHNTDADYKSMFYMSVPLFNAFSCCCIFIFNNRDQKPILNCWNSFNFVTRSFLVTNTRMSPAASGIGMVLEPR